MNFKKLTAIILVAVLAIAAFAMAASADSTVTVGGATYKVTSPKTVAITGEGVSPSYRGNGSIDVLMDGDVARSVTNHDQKGIVLIINDEVNKKATTPVKQDLNSIPVASIEMDFGSEVSFDTAYMAIYWQQVCIGEPADNKVIIETSKDGKVWVPAGTDGTYYFSMRKCPDYEDGLPNGGDGYPHIGEVAVPLGETVKARYVRYSYSFAPIPKDFAWEWYTNVYEFIGFTEVGVATFQSGRKPAKLSAKDVANLPAVEGSCIAEDGDKVTVATFKDDKGELEYIAEVFAKADYLAQGVEAEAQETVKGNYFVEGNKVVVITKGGYDDYKASFDGDGNLLMELDGEETVYYTVKNYTAANPGAGETSGDTSSDDTSSGDETSGDESSVAESSADETTSEVTSSVASSANSTSSTASVSGAGSSSDGADDEGGFPMVALIAIIAGVAAVAAAVIVIVVRKKKK